MSWRANDQHELDGVLASSAARVVDVEVKARASLQPADIKGLKGLAAMAGEHCLAGLLLDDGLDTPPPGPGLWAMPLAMLWET